MYFPSSDSKLNSDLIQSDNIDHLYNVPIDKTGRYFVNCPNDSFPYAYGYLETNFGSDIGELVAHFHSTGDDNRMYINVYRHGAWTGWKPILTETDIQSTNNYIKLPDGTLIHYGVSNTGSVTGGVGFIENHLSFTPAFIDNNYSVSITIVSERSIPDTNIVHGKVWGTNENAVIFSSDPNIDYSWIAIGRWK